MSVECSAVMSSNCPDITKYTDITSELLQQQGQLQQRVIRMAVVLNRMLTSKDKVTIHSGFFGTVPILNEVSRKNHNSPRMPICPVFGLVFRICPDLPISAAICEKLAQILSVP